MTEQEYRAHSAIANSDLSYIAKSQAHFLNYKANGSVSSPAMEFGTLFHAIILEPDKFNELVVTEDSFMEKHPEAVSEGQPNRRLKVYQEWKKLIDPDKILLDIDKSKLLSKMLEAVKNHDLVVEFLNEDYIAEKPIFFEYHGVPCKAKPDYVWEGEDIDIIIDFKTIENALDAERAVTQREYYRQAAFYSLAQQSKTGKENIFYLCFVEKDEPNGVRLMQVNQDYLNLGKDRIATILNKYKQFPATPPKTVYGEGVELLTPPDWLINRITEEYE